MLRLDVLYELSGKRTGPEAGSGPKFQIRPNFLTGKQIYQALAKWPNFVGISIFPAEIQNPGCRWLGAHAADQIQMNNEEGAEFFSRWGNILYMQRSVGLFGI